MKVNFKIGDVTISREGTSLEDEAKKLSTHFSTLARLAGDGRENEFGTHPANVNYVPQEPAAEAAPDKQSIAADDVGKLDARNLTER